jgi:hypothetical protein
MGGITQATKGTMRSAAEPPCVRIANHTALSEHIKLNIEAAFM